MSRPNITPDSLSNPPPGRRDALRTLGALALLGSQARCAAQSETNPADGAPANCTAVPTPLEAGWVEVPLDLYPELRTPGSSAEVRIPEAFLDVILIHTLEDCFLATWRICPHGACTVNYTPEARELRCPCHGSRFGEDGSLLHGPAARALASFPAARIGDSVFIQRQ